MGVKRLIGSSAIALCVIAVIGCQAPGFMGLSGNTTPDGTTEGVKLVRARFRVLVPQSLAQGLTVAPETPLEATQSGNSYQDAAVVGARIFLEGQPSVSDTTDEWGVASLAVPQGQLVPVRAEFKTPSGTVSMTALIQVPRDAQQAPLFTVSVATTLVTSKIAQRFKFDDLKYLNPVQIQAAIVSIDQAIRTPRGDYDPQIVPNLNRQWSVLDTARTIARLDPILSEALGDVLATVIPTADPATSSVASGSLAVASGSLLLAGATSSFLASESLEASSSASASLNASRSLDASGSVSALDARYFPFASGQSWDYEVFDAAHKPAGQFTRTVEKVTARANGALYSGSETGKVGGQDADWTFLLRHTGDKVRFVASFRPAVEYPLPLLDGQKWLAAPGIRAIAHAPSHASGLDGETWRIDFQSNSDNRRSTWSEWLAPGIGYTRFQWYDARSARRWEARLVVSSPEPSTP